MARKIKVCVLGSHNSLQRLVDRGDIEFHEFFDPNPHDITIPLFEEQHTRWVNDVQPDFVVCINVRISTPKCNAWIRTLRVPGVKVIMWGLDSNRHAVVEHDQAARYWYCLDDDVRNPADPYLPVYAPPRPIVPLDQRRHRCGIVCNRYGGHRDDEIRKIERHLDFNGVVPFHRYHDLIAGFRYGLNIATHYDGLPNYRTFELAAAGVWQICSTRNRNLLEPLFDYGISYYDRIEELPGILDSLGDYDPSRIQRQVATRHTLANRVRTMLAEFGVDVPIVEADGVEWTLEDYWRRRAAARPTARGEQPRLPRPGGAPLASVLVPCTGPAPGLRETVRSALAQGLSELEVVVADGSGDAATWAEAQALAAEDPRVRPVRLGAGAGAAGTWRQAAAHARGTFAGLLLPGDRYEREFLAEAVALLEQDPGAGFAYGAARAAAEVAAPPPGGPRAWYQLEGAAVRPSAGFLADALERRSAGTPVTPSCALFRRTDLVTWLGAEAPDPGPLGAPAPGAGLDLSLYLQACLAAPRLGHLGQPRVVLGEPAPEAWDPASRAARALARLDLLAARRPPGVDLPVALQACWLDLAGHPRRAEAERLACRELGFVPEPIPGLPRTSLGPLPPAPEGSPYAVTAIVSAFKSARFMRGCLDDLLGQTLHAQGRLEILVVDTGSPEDEGAIVREYQQRSPHLRYLRTEDRRTIYAAWNLGAWAATGRYLTNANTDDRHRADALERLAAELDARPEVGLVYADCLWTRVENESFDTTTTRLRAVWPPFSVETLRGQCMVGPQPMWRRALHARHGGFHEPFTSAGDWEFWLRLASTERFAKVDDVLGLYLLNPAGAELGNPASRAEADQIRRHYAISPIEVQQRARFETWDVAEAPGCPAVSVVVSGTAGPQLLSMSASSVALQTFQDWELVLVDEDAGGETSTLVARLRARLPTLRISVVRQRPGSTSDGWNAGLASASGRWILVLDDGHLLEAGCLQRALQALEAEATAAVAFADVAGRPAGSPPSSALLHRTIFDGGLRFPAGADGQRALRDALGRLGQRGVPSLHLKEPLVLDARPARGPDRAPAPGATGAPFSIPLGLGAPPPPSVKFRVSRAR